jgi:hypothetical protein
MEYKLCMDYKAPFETQNVHTAATQYTDANSVRRVEAAECVNEVATS